MLKLTFSRFKAKEKREAPSIRTLPGKNRNQAEATVRLLLASKSIKCAQLETNQTRTPAQHGSEPSLLEGCGVLFCGRKRHNLGFKNTLQCARVPEPPS